MLKCINPLLISLIFFTSFTFFANFLPIYESFIRFGNYFSYLSFVYSIIFLIGFKSVVYCLNVQRCEHVCFIKIIQILYKKKYIICCFLFKYFFRCFRYFFYCNSRFFFPVYLLFTPFLYCSPNGERINAMLFDIIFSSILCILLSTKSNLA